MNNNEEDIIQKIKEQIEKTGYLRIKAIPQSGINELVEILESPDTGQTFKVKIKAPPEKNKANIELIRFLSKKLELKKSQLEIISGKTERIKLLRINP